jgi:hypothetical protein
MATCLDALLVYINVVTVLLLSGRARAGESHNCVPLSVNWLACGLDAQEGINTAVHMHCYNNFN